MFSTAHLTGSIVALISTRREFGLVLTTAFSKFNKNLQT